MKRDGSFEGVSYKKQFDVFNFKTSREQTEFDREIKKLRNWLAKISAPSFKDLPNKLSKPAALDGFKPFKYLILLQEMFQKTQNLSIQT